jgi:hypothetical protein
MLGEKGAFARRCALNITGRHGELLLDINNPAWPGVRPAVFS